MRDSSKLDLLSKQIIGAAIEVHKEIGPGHLEAAYEEALAYEFSLRDIIYERQKEIPVYYKKRLVSRARLDFLIDNEIVLELKAVEMLLPVHRAQILSYMKAGKIKKGLLINFNVALLHHGVQRFIC